jgi:iron complex outermembrane receptor protein
MLVRTRLTVAFFVIHAAGLASVAGGQDTVPRRLPPVVTVTRDVGRSPLDLPYAISSTRPDSIIPGQSHTLVEQTLALLPGVTVANRSNPSQDTRVSIRGFGARSAFGVRSIRVLRDGMPLTLPDGQTPIDYLDLEAVSRVESIRGTASALYGNASGGVIDLRTAPAPLEPAAAQARWWAGPNGMRRTTLLFGGPTSALSYQGNIGRTENSGYREFARQRLTNSFARVSGTLAGTDFALVGLGLDMPVAQNPGALTKSQVDSAPRMADPLSIRKIARKEVDQIQIGLSARRPIPRDGEVVVQGYTGTRSLYNPLTFAVVGVDRRLGGAAGRVTLPFATGDVVNRVSVGVDFQRLNDARKNWANCNAVPTANASCPTVNIDKGVLQLDQREIVSSLGPYLRDEVEIGKLRATAGVRADNIRFEVHDNFLTDNRDDSGERTLHAVSPMFGAAFRLAPAASVYANLSSAFETPTTTELGNQPDGSAGLNRDLKPQYSTTFETGVKGILAAGIEYDVAAFQTNVRDELIPFEIPNGNGRTYFRNAGRTQRRGVEVALGTQFGMPVGRGTIDASYSLSNFRFGDFQVGTNQYSGNRIPGIPQHVFQMSATWRVRDLFLTADGTSKSRVFVNDANAASAPGYAVVNARAGLNAAVGKPWLMPVVGVLNMLDRRYIGSVAVNASGASLAATKFYEPAPGRTWLIGLSAATSPW